MAKAIPVKEIDMNKLSAHELLEMFRRGEHLSKNSDAFFLHLITQSAILEGNERARAVSKL